MRLRYVYVRVSRCKCDTTVCSSWRYTLSCPKIVFRPEPLSSFLAMRSTSLCAVSSRCLIAPACRERPRPWSRSVLAEGVVIVFLAKLLFWHVKCLLVGINTYQSVPRQVAPELRIPCATLWYCCKTRVRRPAAPFSSFFTLFFLFIFAVDWLRIFTLNFLFRRSEFLIATSKKKKSVRLCGCSTNLGFCVENTNLGFSVGYVLCASYVGTWYQPADHSMVPGTYVQYRASCRCSVGGETIRLPNSKFASSIRGTSFFFSFFFFLVFSVGGGVLCMYVPFFLQRTTHL